MVHIRKIHTNKRETEKRKHRDDEHEEGNGKRDKRMLVLQHPLNKVIAYLFQVGCLDYILPLAKFSRKICIIKSFPEKKYESRNDSKSNT